MVVLGLGLSLSLALSPPALGQTCTSTITNIEKRCRDAILLHKFRYADMADRLGVCEDHARDLQNVPDPPSDLGLGIAIGAGAMAALTTILGLVLILN